MEGMSNSTEKTNSDETLVVVRETNTFRTIKLNELCRHEHIEPEENNIKHNTGANRFIFIHKQTHDASDEQ